VASKLVLGPIMTDRKGTGVVLVELFRKSG